MMGFDNRNGSKLYTTNATHDSEYNQKIKDNFEVKPKDTGDKNAMMPQDVQSYRTYGPTFNQEEN